jgi:predicted nucleic acid-binding protein
VIYFDSSLLVRLYVREAGWTEVVEAVSDASEPLPIVFLHELEIVNAMYRAVFEKLIDREQRAASLELFRDDVRTGLYRRFTLDLPDLTHRALQIVQGWTEKLGVRSLNVLHVAAAQAVGATHFATADARQRKLAHAVGFPT